MVDGFHRLGHDAVVRRYNDDGHVRHFGASGTHRREGFVAGRIEERDFLSVEVYAVSADVLRDTARFAFDDIGLADVVQQRGLAVVYVAHDGYDRRSLHEVLFVVAVFVNGLLNVHCDEFDLEAELLGDDDQRLRIEPLVDGDHQSQVHACRDDLRNGNIHHGGQFADRHEFGDLEDGLLHMCLLHRLVHAGTGVESLLLTVLRSLVLASFGGETGERILYLLRNLFVAHFGAYDGFRSAFFLPVLPGLRALRGSPASALTVAGTLSAPCPGAGGLLFRHIHLVFADALAFFASAAGRTEALYIHLAENFRSCEFRLVTRTEDVVAVLGHALVVGLLLYDDFRFGCRRSAGLRFRGGGFSGRPCSGRRCLRSGL